MRQAIFNISIDKIKFKISKKICVLYNFSDDNKNLYLTLRFDAKILITNLKKDVHVP